MYIPINEPNFSCSYKHIDIFHHHLAQKNVKESFMKMMYCNIMDMVTNILTKRLFVDKHEHFQCLTSAVKLITQHFIKWICWTSYQVPFIKLLF
jgi:hypothetical protein